MILLKELNANVNAMCTSSTLKSASRTIFAVAELLVKVIFGEKRVVLYTDGLHELDRFGTITCDHISKLILTGR